ncbi:MAG: rhodanese-like domain-containing protein [Ignavibacteria bacterium]|nr:rhodanese-like domain-containing protein [Ignavibacteria bacterium]
MKKINFKKVLPEAVLIILFSVLVAIVFNYFNPKGINLLQKPTVVSDSTLERLLGSTDSLVVVSMESTNKPQDSIALNSFSEKVSLNPKADEVQNKNQDKILPKSESSYLNEDFKVPEIIYEQLIKYINSPNIILVDARRPEDYQQGHIANALNIFAFESDVGAYFQNLSKVPFGDNYVIIVYCEGGACDASHKVAKDLLRLGHKNVFVYAGGWEDWLKKRGN